MRALIFVGSVLVACACKGASTDAPRFTASDSSGVRLATSTAPAWDSTPQWRLADSPRVAVGAADGPEEYLVTWIWDALLLGDGSLIIGNAGGHDLRWYDGAGRFVRKAGRLGAGPGEFGEFADLMMWRLPAGELAVRDAVHRLNVFDSTGAFRRTVTFAASDSGSLATPEGTFADGSYLALAGEVIPQSPRARCPAR